VFLVQVDDLVSASGGLFAGTCQLSYIYLIHTYMHTYIYREPDINPGFLYIFQVDDFVSASGGLFAGTCQLSYMYI